MVKLQFGVQTRAITLYKVEIRPQILLMRISSALMAKPTVETLGKLVELKYQANYRSGFRRFLCLQAPWLVISGPIEQAVM